LIVEGSLGCAGALSSVSLAAAAAGRSLFLFLLLDGIVCVFQQIICILVTRSDKIP